MPVYDMTCCECGSVIQDVRTFEPIGFGVKTSVTIPTRTDAGIDDVPLRCPACGCETWTRSKPAHLCARTSREWAIGCKLDKHG